MGGRVAGSSYDYDYNYICQKASQYRSFYTESLNTKYSNRYITIKILNGYQNIIIKNKLF